MWIRFDRNRRELRLRSLPGLWHWIFLLLPIGSAVAIAVQSPTIAVKAWEGFGTSPGTTVIGILSAVGLVVGGTLLFTSLWLAAWKTAVVSAWQPVEPGYRGYAAGTSIQGRRGLRRWSAERELRGFFRAYASESSYRGGIQYFLTLDVRVEAADDKKRCIENRWLEVINEAHGSWGTRQERQLSAIREAMVALGYREGEPVDPG